MAWTKRCGAVGGALAFIATMQGLISCGEGFSEGDCKASRTCAPAGGGESAEGGSSVGDEGGAGARGPGGSDGDSGGVGGADDSGTPNVTSVSPAPEATDAEPDADIVITFSEPLAADTVTTDSIQILDGDTVIPGTVSYADGSVTFTPMEPLALIADYAVKVTTEITDLDGVAMAEDYESTFTTRDGIWHTTTVAVGALDGYRARTIPVTSDGRMFLSWTSQDGSGYCSSLARWFRRGEPIGAGETFTASIPTTSCDSPIVDGNADGAAGLAWFAVTVDVEGNPVEYDAGVHGYRDGDWVRLGQQHTGAAALGVAPSGSISYLIQTGVGAEMRFAADGAEWDGEPKDIAPGHIYSNGLPARFAFAPNDDGFVIWRSQVPGGSGKDEILVAAYTKAGGWQLAAALPGSVGSTAADRRGNPNIAVDGQGGAMALWVRGGSSANSGALVASRYAAGNWTQPTPVSGNVVVSDTNAEPALVFDGETYVAAWTGEEGGYLYTYSAHFDVAASQWHPHQVRTETPVVDYMPRLGADAHQNLLLTWVEPSPTGASWIYARYRAKTGTWTDPQAVDDGEVGNGLDSYSPGPLGVAPSGVGALMWTKAPAIDAAADVRYASFH